MADAMEQLRQKVAKAEQVPASERTADMQMWLEGFNMAQVAEVFTPGPLSPESSLWRWAAHQAASSTVDGLLAQVSTRAQSGGCGGRPGSSGGGGCTQHPCPAPAPKPTIGCATAEPAQACAIVWDVH
jgi:hypothetical protein